MVDTEVCSTHVEMFLLLKLSTFQQDSLLHACGDVSDSPTGFHFAVESAPRMWRCFSAADHRALEEDVCSTHVEMFPGAWNFMADTSSSAPRMCRCF